MKIIVKELDDLNSVGLKRVTKMRSGTLLRPRKKECPQKRLGLFYCRMLQGLGLEKEGEGGVGGNVVESLPDGVISRLWDSGEKWDC